MVYKMNMLTRMKVENIKEIEKCIRKFLQKGKTSGVSLNYLQNDKNVAVLGFLI